ncbi:MAG: small multi-drug export protein [Anaerovoracaceae bacterium]
MAGFWGSYFGNMIMTFLVSMVPVLELRGAIPVGVANGLDVKVALIVAILGNLVPVPFIIIFIRKIFLWMRTRSERLNGIVVKLENKAAEKSEIVNKYEWWGLVILVAIPLPGTGAWTGALVAAMLNMRLKRAFPAIAIGVVIAGIIVSYLTYGATMLF